MAQAHLAVLGNRAGDAEGLEALADGLGGVGSGGHVLLQSDGGAHAVRPGGVFKADGLDALDDVVGVEACLLYTSSPFVKSFFGEKVPKFHQFTFFSIPKTDLDLWGLLRI